MDLLVEKEWYIQWNADAVVFVLDQHAYLGLNSASSLKQQSARRYVDMYMLSGCELIDTENISLSSQNMKFTVEQADIFQYQSYSHSDDIFIILKITINTDTSIFVFSREKLHDSKYSKYASLKP
jgi:hypothetical protein